MISGPIPVHDPRHLWLNRQSKHELHATSKAVQFVALRVSMGTRFGRYCGGVQRVGGGGTVRRVRGGGTAGVGSGVGNDGSDAESAAQRGGAYAPATSGGYSLWFGSSARRDAPCPSPEKPHKSATTEEEKSSGGQARRRGQVQAGQRHVWVALSGCELTRLPVSRQFAPPARVWAGTELEGEQRV